MKSIKEVFKKLKKGDFAVVGIVIILSLTLFGISFFSSGNLSAQIYLDGELHKEINLYELEKSDVLNVGGCEILFERDGVTFLSSECTDKLCVNRGKLKKAGDTMACVPERVSVVLHGAENGIDAVVF